MQMNVNERIKAQLDGNPVVLYMKGTPDFPQCGFSGQTVQVLNACGAATPEPSPTVDVAAVQTSAVETFAAGLTQTFFALPTDTPTPVPTDTPVPTNTPPAPTDTPVVPTLTPVPPSPTPTPKPGPIFSAGSSSSRAKPRR